MFANVQYAVIKLFIWYTQLLNILIYVYLKNIVSFFFILKPVTIYSMFSINLFITIWNLLFKTLKFIGIALSLNNVCFTLSDHLKSL